MESKGTFNWTYSHNDKIVQWSLPLPGGTYIFTQPADQFVALMDYIKPFIEHVRVRVPGAPGGSEEDFALKWDKMMREADDFGDITTA